MSWLRALVVTFSGLSLLVTSGLAQGPYTPRYAAGGHSLFAPGYQPQSEPLPSIEGYSQAPAEAWAMEPAYTEAQVPWLGLDAATTAPMLDFQNRQGDKQLLLLDSHARSGGETKVILGAQFRVSGIAAQTNSANRFPYLGRFPTDFTGDTATDVRLLQANQSMIAHVGDWTTGYFETLFSDVFTFPSFNQGSFQVRQAYVVFGNQEVTPFYLFAGKKNVSFGDFSTLSPFTQAVPWHYFAPLAEGVGAGFANGGWNITAMALNGSRGIRVADSKERGHLNNFAANASYAWQPADAIRVQVGAGYLYGTIYDGTTAEHINPQIFGPRNGAWDVNGHVQLGGWHFAGEYVETENVWPVVDHKVSAMKAEVAYDFESLGAPLWLSASWSEGIQGASGDAWRSNAQLVVGARWTFNPHAMLSLEYVRSTGFAPLINITTVSDPDVVQDSLVVGFVLTI
ncbi:MAG: LbtU family siderophore porin [Planctomycetaceae bacterium]